MVIFTDPKRDNQVMALYSHDTTSRVWTDLGYDRHELDDHPEVMRLGRDCYVAFSSHLLTLNISAIARVTERINPVSPAA